MLDANDEKILLAVFVMVVICIIVGCLSYIRGCKDAKNHDSEMHDFEEAKAAVKKDDRLIKCNGMAIPFVCMQCVFGRLHVDGTEYCIECFAPDFDGVPVIGLRKTNDK